MSRATSEPRADELVAFARGALLGMQLDDGVFCHEVVAPGERASGGRLGRGRRVPAGDRPTVRGRSLRYSWIVLVGLLRGASSDVGVDPGALKDALMRELTAHDLQPGDLGLALWADARSGAEAPDRLLDVLGEMLGSRGLDHLETLEVAWMVVGAAEAAAAGASLAEPLLARTRERLLARAGTPTGLLLQHDLGGRARFPHFATQIYGVLALARLARRRDDGEAREAAVKVADALLRLQLADGAWPWIYDVNKGTVIEPYRLYSVHQDAMAPMALLELSEATSESRYQDAALRGLEWVWGQNELGAEMLDREAGMLYRSINRRGVRDRACLWVNSLTGRQLFGWPGSAVVERTDRPYHLGWVLEAWGAPAS